jgi:predicted DNA-binding protein
MTAHRAEWEWNVPRSREASTVVTVRVSANLNRSIERAARMRRRTKSEVVREILEQSLRGREGFLDPAREARRQSLLVSPRRSEQDVLAFIERVGDRRGWR